ncbi:MAG: hypothetical protein NW200_11230 [Hyphomonadaceae bacterium]|nr:hypothetical protein [Hyphomonadaceae bacterium]
MKFDNRLGVALIVTIVLETAAAFVWAGRAAARLDAVEARVAQQAPVAERLARLEVRADDARASLERIERRLDRDRR